MNEKKERTVERVTVIVHSGDKTYANSYADGVVRKGSTRRHVGDTYDPVVGAGIALARAYGTDPMGLAERLLDLYLGHEYRSAVKQYVAEHGKPEKKRLPVVKIESAPKRKYDLDGMPCGKVRVGRVKLQLTGTAVNDDKGHTEHMGVMGTPTKFKDNNGRELHVGDLVTLETLTGTVRGGRKWKAVPGLHFVVDEHSDLPESKGQYIMCMLSGCNDKTGKLDGRTRVTLAKTWKEVETGEVHDFIKAVWEGED